MALSASDGRSGRAVGQLDPARQRQRAAGPVDDDGVGPARPVGRDLAVEIVVAGQPELGTAGIAGLIEQRRGVAGRMLVELGLHAAAGIVEQQRRRLDREPVGRVRRGGDAEQRHVLQRQQARDVDPGSAVEHDQLRLVADIGDQSRIGRVEAPGAVGGEGDGAGLSGPIAAAGRLHQIGVAVGEGAGRRRQVAVEQPRAGQRVELIERLVMGDVLLRLRGGQQRQAAGAVLHRS